MYLYLFQLDLHLIIEIYTRRSTQEAPNYNPEFQGIAMFVSFFCHAFFTIRWNIIVSWAFQKTPKKQKI
jgi:hypothetical protein